MEEHHASGLCCVACCYYYFAFVGIGGDMKSIIQNEKTCLFCGRQNFIEEHHCFGGANRKLSEKYGLKVYLCHWCHNEAPNGVHFNAKRMRLVRQIGQRAFEEKHSHEEFMRIFGANYL